MFANASFARRLRHSRHRLPFGNRAAIDEPATVPVAVVDATSASSDATGRRLQPADDPTEGQSPVIPDGATRTGSPRAGIHLYLVSVALVAAIIVGILLGMGSYLLVDRAEGPAPENQEPFEGGKGTPDLIPGSAVGEVASDSKGTSSPREEMPTPSSRASEMRASVPEPIGMVTMPAMLSDVSQPAPSVASAEPPGGPATVADASAGASPESTPSSAVIRGLVTDAPNAATWVVADRTIRLWSIEPQSSNAVAALVKWVRDKGPVECVPRAKTGRYQCYTATGEDIAEAALLAGVARAGDPAPAVYRNAEEQARRKGKGQWERR